jgi:UDP-N-acetyl-D-mannosaminuronate dehydrogenase
MEKQKPLVAVIGLGEVGTPLLQLISEHCEAIGIDISSTRVRKRVDVMHLCYPAQIASFIDESLRYIRLYRPRLTIIESSVPIGTTRAIAQQTQTLVAHSPVRGKHARMSEDLRRYVKFVGAIDPVAARQAALHFQSIGLTTKILSSPEATELAKLSETTYFGVLIAWAQQVERACIELGASYDEVVSFYEEISFFPPVKYFPGVIGGHCVMPNIELLRQRFHSELVEAVLASNRKKMGKEAPKPRARTSSKIMSARSAG